MGYSHIYNPRAADYLIKLRGSVIEGIDGSTGFILTSSTDFKTVFDAVMDLIPTGTSFKTKSRIMIGSGDYDISGSLVIDTHSVSISGQGYSHNYGSTRLILDNGVDDDIIKVAGNYVTLENMMIKGNKTNQSAGNGVNATTHAGMQIRNLTVTDCFNKGIFSQGGDETVIFNAIVKDCDGYGIHLENGGFITNCWIDSCDRGMDVTASHVFASEIEKCLSYGIRANNNAIIMGCYLYDNTGYGIRCVANDNIVIGNRINCNAKSTHGISTVGARNLVFGNYVTGGTTGQYSHFGDASVINGIGKESANAEEPQLTTWQIGNIVDFVDSGDASGDGIYIKNTAGNWVKID